MSDNRTAIVVETLRFFADDWIGATDDDRKWLRETADSIENGAIDRRATCPLCSEITCDSNCPLRPVRHKEPESHMGSLDMESQRRAELRGEPFLDPATCPHSAGTRDDGRCIQCGIDTSQGVLVEHWAPHS